METQQSQVKTADIALIIDYSVWKSVCCLPLVPALGSHHRGKL